MKLVNDIIPVTGGKGAELLSTSVKGSILGPVSSGGGVAVRG